MSKGKKVLVLYQDWGNWFEDDYQKFEYWFKKLDGAYDKNNEYYFLAFGNEDKVIKKEINIYIKIIKSSPQRQLIDLKKLKEETKKVIKDFKPEFIYSPYIYLLSVLPKSNKYKTIGYLRDITGMMILSNKNIKALFGIAFFVLDYIAFKKINLILYNRKSLVNYISKLGFKGDHKYNPRPIVDIEYYSKKASISVVNKFNLKYKKVILTIARLSAEKNLEMGIKALKNMPEEYVYLIIGEGHLKPNLQTLVKSLKLTNRVKFVGYIEHKFVWDYYKIADVFWLLSKTEAMPNVLQEAFYAKVPVIVSKIEAMKNIVDKKTGILLETWDENELAKKTINLLEDKKKYKSIQDNQNKKVLQIVKQNKKVKDFFI